MRQRWNGGERADKAFSARQNYAYIINRMSCHRKKHISAIACQFFFRILTRPRPSPFLFGIRLIGLFSGGLLAISIAYMRPIQSALWTKQRQKTSSVVCFFLAFFSLVCLLVCRCCSLNLVRSRLSSCGLHIAASVCVCVCVCLSAVCENKENIRIQFKWTECEKKKLTWKQILQRLNNMQQQNIRNCLLFLVEIRRCLNVSPKSVESVCAYMR